MQTHTTLPSHLGYLQVSGPDAAKLLQGQLTCDVREVTAEQARLGALCDPKGRVLATFYLLLIDTDYYLLLPRAMIEETQKILSKYAVFYKVKLTPLTAQDINLSGTGDTSISRSLGFEISTDTWHWELLQIKAGIATIYPQTSGLFTPHQLNYPLVNGVSFNKGCYTGQEIIARTQYRGKTKQRLYRVELACSQTPPPGTQLYDVDSNQEIAILITAVSSSTATSQALVVASDVTSTRSVFWENQGKTSLTVLDLPYLVD